MFPCMRVPLVRDYGSGESGFMLSKLVGLLLKVGNIEMINCTPLLWEGANFGLGCFTTIVDVLGQRAKIALSGMVINYPNQQ